MAKGLWYPPGLLYDGLLEPILHSIRKRVRNLALENDLFPLLELCCGPGAQAGHLADRGKLVCGLDINLRMLKYAAVRRRDVPFICADAVQTPCLAGVFKGIVLSFSLHEKPAALRPRLLAEARRLLAPHGRIVLVDFEPPWNRTSRLAYLYTFLIERLAGKDHFRNGREFNARGGLRALLRANGLKELERFDIPVGTCAVVLAAPG